VKLRRKGRALSVAVKLDPVTAAAIAPFDLAADAPVEFFPWERPAGLPQVWGIGLIVGASGSGKSTLLREFGEVASAEWHPGRSIAGHFRTGEEAATLLSAAGLNAVPTWRKPYRVLSTGERFRADLARMIRPDAVVDEYTSVVSRPVAQSASRSLRKYVAAEGLTGIVIATCHRDVIPWLAPDWVIDTDAGEWLAGGEVREEWRMSGLVEVGGISLRIRR